MAAMNGTNKTPKALTRIAPSMTLDKLARKTGLTVAGLSYIFTGERAGKVDSIAKIARAVKKSPGELLDYLTKIRARNKRAKKRGQRKGRIVYGVARKN